MHAIEHFAWLCATLDAGFFGRHDVLAAAGLDEAQWKALCDEWLPLLATGAAPEVAVRFASTYADARQTRVGGSPTPSELAPIATAVGLDDADDTEESLAPAGVLEAERTAELVLPPLGPVMPFLAATVLAPPISILAPCLSGAAAQPMPCDSNERTLEVPLTPPPPRPALPFDPVPTGRRQRRISFDTQTGKPLKEPYWVDDPTPRSS